MTAQHPIDPPPDSGRRGRAYVFTTGDHTELAAAMLDTIESDAPVVADLGALHRYSASTGAWTPVERGELSRIVQGYSGRLYGTQTDSKPKPIRIRAADVAGAMLLGQDQAARPGFFSDAAPGVAFTNGFARLAANGIDFQPHDPENGARFSYRFAYAANAPCARWLACLADAFQGDADAAEKIAALQEFAGASLFGIAPKYKRALVLFGEGDNAKSTIANIIKAGMPTGSTCAVAPQTWGSEYRLALMAGKLLNVVNELPESDIIAGSDFKDMIAGDDKTARSPAEKPFTFKPIAGHLFAANRLPGSNDQTHGFWLRMLVLTFNRTFAEHEKNPHLADEIIAAELPGIVAWMVEGATRLLRQRHYTTPPSSAGAVAEWKRGSDPVATFIEERTVRPENIHERATCEALYAAFKGWAERGGFKGMSKKTLGHRMKSIGLGMEAGHFGRVYPVRLLLPDEVSPLDRAAAEEAAERETADAAAREARAAAEPDPAEVWDR